VFTVFLRSVNESVNTVFLENSATRRLFTLVTLYYKDVEIIEIIEVLSSIISIFQGLYRAMCFL
jgi:hypothetical protein